MSKSLLQRAEQSVAFDIDAVVRLNKKAAQIDPRLYLFAYYQPKPLPEYLDARMCFCTAVLNMYGLLWDCGKMVQHQLFGLSGPTAIQTLVKSDLNNCNEFFSIISNVRTCICHNNSNHLFYNRDKSSGCQGYLEKAAGVSTPINTYADAQWVRVCQDFIDRCEWFVNVLDYFLDQILKESDLKKAYIIQYWIWSISRWYQTDIELITHALADRYKLKILTSSMKNTVVTKYRVAQWVGIAWRKKNPPLVLTKTKDYYLNYIAACQAKISNIMNAHDCPKPALPLEVLTIATADARMFKI